MGSIIKVWKKRTLVCIKYIQQCYDGSQQGVLKK
jgi:hypothetical protein